MSSNGDQNELLSTNSLLIRCIAQWTDSEYIDSCKSVTSATIMPSGIWRTDRSEYTTEGNY